ncbi:Catechol-2,3-dioxygenase [Bacillus sp. cl95]|nr:Catechol-2,3-dioxygenase [Bacillus sp. UNCCL13]SFQ63012.1 Catechol-2,3-dioxygenase [Bacillus sp. cl95]
MMRIYQVHIKCFNLENMKDFYQNILLMELVSSTDASFSVMAGSTKLIFEKDTSTPFYHLCFRTGSDYFDFIYERLAQRSLLLPDEEGNYSLFWEGKQAYFVDPDGNIMELLERPVSWSGAKELSGWHDIGEVGMPVNSVEEMRNNLSSVISNIYKAESDRFAFYGDREGVFVLVKEGRNWYPTERAATIYPLKIVVSGPEEARFYHEEFDYEIKVKKQWDGEVPAVQFRMARPTNQLEKIEQFYKEGLGLKKIGEFRKHEGYDGLMFGLPNYGYHLEFTQFEEFIELPLPTKEHLLVFYITSRYERDKIVSRLAGMGFPAVTSENPYWARGGVTIEDPDGWRIVLMNSVGIG